MDENGASDGQSGAPEGPKWSPGGPKWSPMAQDGGQQGAKCYPKGLRESLVSLGARQLSPKMRPREPRAGAWSILASAFGAQGAPQGGRNWAKEGTKSGTENTLVSDHVLGPIFFNLGGRKASLLGIQNGAKYKQGLQGAFVNYIRRT